MRTQTFISSMVGVVAAAAVAGSASAGFVDGFTTAFDTSMGTDLFGIFMFEYSSLTTSGPNASLFNTRFAAHGSTGSGSRASIDGLGSASIVVGSVNSSRALLSYFDSSSTFEPSGSTLDMSSTPGFSVNVGSWAGTGLTFTLFVFGAYDATQSVHPELGRVAVTASGNGTVTFNKASFVPTAGPIDWSAIGRVALEMARTTATTGDGSTTNFTIDNFTNTVPVPAPGAAALIGLAGAFMSRRRRN